MRLVTFGPVTFGPVNFGPALDNKHTNPWRIIYHINLKKEEGFDLPNGGAAVGYVIPEEGVDDPRYVGFWPIDVDLKQDTVHESPEFRSLDALADDFED